MRVTSWPAKLRYPTLVAWFLAVSCNAVVAADLLIWKELPALPDPVGFAGPFAGVAGDSLIVAGGANFPEAPPWDGGRKVWYRDAYRLDRPEGNWRRIADALPRPLGYGAAVSLPEGLLCIGGSDAERHYADVFLLRVDGEGLAIETFPSLPQSVAHPAAVLLGDSVYVAGGLVAPDAATPLKTFWRLDLSVEAAKRKWETLEPCPGRPRFLATAGVLNGEFYLIGGVDLVAGSDGTPAREYLRDAWRFVPGNGWGRTADLPVPLAASPSPTVSVGASQLMIAGGDTGEHALRIAELRDRHPGFSRTLIIYDAKTNRWNEQEDLPFPAAVTTSVVPWHDRLVIPTGEIRPAVRTPKVTFAVPQADFLPD